MVAGVLCVGGGVMFVLFICGLASKLEMKGRVIEDSLQVTSLFLEFGDLKKRL